MSIEAIITAAFLVTLLLAAFTRPHPATFGCALPIAAAALYLVAITLWPTDSSPDDLGVTSMFAFVAAGSIPGVFVGSWIRTRRGDSSGDMKNLTAIPAVITLLRAYFDRQAGRTAKAKARIEEIQVKYPNMFEFLDAYYGFILITERGDENTENYFHSIESAERYFSSNINRLPAEKDDNQRYIELYCQLFLGARKEEFDWGSIIYEAHQLKPDDLTKMFLVMPTRDPVSSSLSA